MLTLHGSHGTLLLPLVNCNAWWGHDRAPSHTPAGPTHDRVPPPPSRHSGGWPIKASTLHKQARRVTENRLPSGWQSTAPGLIVQQKAQRQMYAKNISYTLLWANAMMAVVSRYPVKAVT